MIVFSFETTESKALFNNKTITSQSFVTMMKVKTA